MSHMNNLNFPDYMFALSLLHTIEDNFLEAKAAYNAKTEHTP